MVTDAPPEFDQPFHQVGIYTDIDDQYAPPLVPEEEITNDNDLDIDSFVTKEECQHYDHTFAPSWSKLP
jgi:hypothetical protein